MTDFAKEARGLASKFEIKPPIARVALAEMLAVALGNARASGYAAGLAKAAEIAQTCLVDKVMGVTVTAAVLADAAPPLEITIYDADGAVVVYEVIPAGPSLSEEQYQDVLALIEAGLPAYLAMNLAVANRAGWTLAYAEAKRARQGAG